MNLDAEVLLLSAAFQAQLQVLPANLDRVSQRTVEQLRLRPHAMPVWGEQFSPLTLLYPQLQCAGFAQVDRETVSRANVAHVCFMVHTFLEDRFLDGQVKLDTQQVLFMKHMLLEGLGILHEIDAGDPWLRAERERYVASHTHAQLNGYETPNESDVRFRRSPVATIATGRAAFGILSALSVLRVAGCPMENLRRVMNGYACLVTGMQWADDLEDWREDLAVDDENLLLVALRARGLDPYAHPDDSVRIANVGHALVEHGIIDSARDAARRWLGDAAFRQGQLGCDQLKGLIERQIENLPALARDAVRRIDEDVARASQNVTA